MVSGREQQQQQQQLESLAKGSQVEVSTDEEGLKGAWYVATVVDTPLKSSGSKKKNQNINNSFYVQYQSLFADEDGSKPLREHVNVAFVRPLPPPVEVAFELDDVVDAFYRDGWWTGVITRVLENSRFVVTFQNPPDEIEFGLSDLRVHREWVDGKWIRPEKQRTTGLMFRAGKSVEVSFDGADYRDVWFPAIVLEDFGDNSFLVEQQNSENDNEAGVIKVVVDSFHIRPSPPHLKSRTFILLEKVDVYYRFGWWSGVITKVLAESRYIVFFKHSNKEREVNYSELRPHMELIDGKWVSASQDVIVPSDDQEKGYACSNAEKTEIDVFGSLCPPKNNSVERTPSYRYSRENQIEQSTPCYERPSSYGMTPQKTKSKQAVSDIEASHSRPLKKLKEGNAADAPSLNTMPIQTLSKETVCGIATSITGDPGTNCSKQPVADDQPSATESLSRRKKAQSKLGKVGEVDNLSTGPVKRRGRPPKSQIQSPQQSEGGGKEGNGNAGVNGDEEFVEKECITKEIDIPAIKVECNETKSPQGKKSHKVPIEESPKLMRDQKLQNDPARPKVKEINQLEDEVGDSNQKKRRGRPPKLLVTSPEASVADEIVAKDCTASEGGLTITVVGSTRKRGSRGDGKKHLDSPVRQRNRLSSTKKVPPAKKDKQLKEKVGQASINKQFEKHPLTKGRRRTASVNIESPIEDSQTASRGKTAEVIETGSTLKGAEMTIEELPSSVSDDQPLSMWFEGMQSPTNVDGSSKQQCTETTEKRKENVLHSPEVGANNSEIVTDEYQSLPFVKSFPLWKTIESMEVFKLIPQKPHFRPLDSHKESSREGLAIGCMVTFSSVVKKTSELRFGDPRSIIEDSLETLVDLESHGFDVQLVRDRLTGLLLIKDNQEQLEERSKELESWIDEHKNERAKIDEEIDEIDEQIKELQEKRSRAGSVKESKDSEIATLKSKVDHIKDDMKSVQLDFEGLAVAPW